MCRVSYTKNGVKYTVFRVAYTLAELALTENCVLTASTLLVLWYRLAYWLTVMYVLYSVLTLVS